ncbi:MAG: hypothetical protein GY866_26725 [Proteobacteria bacterium]|nr:hypothetical protein [Pseudomonadota bacterium]
MRQFHDSEDSRQTGVPKYWFFVSRTDKKRKKDVKAKKKRKEEEERHILCGHCRNRITLPVYKMEVQNDFTHTFLNPAGMVFNIGCFEKADGCVVVGDPTSEWTWFVGFDWQSALCSQCLKHLGWFYNSTTNQDFFGLILDTLI